MSSTTVLECEVNDIVGVLNSQHAALVDRVVVLLADERLWAGEGMTSMSAWVAWRAGMSPAMARSIVAIAERVDELPASTAAFRRGNSHSTRWPQLPGTRQRGLMCSHVITRS